MSDFLVCSVCGAHGTEPSMKRTLVGAACPICLDEAHRIGSEQQPLRVSSLGLVDESKLIDKNTVVRPSRGSEQPT